MIAYQYTAILRPFGVTLPSGSSDILVLSDDRKKLTAHLSRAPDTRVLHLDRVTALSDLLLGAITGVSTSSLDEALPSYVELVQKRRKTKYGDGPFLILEASGVVDPTETRPASTKEFDGFVLSIGGIRSRNVRDLWAESRASAIAALVLACGSVDKVDTIADGSVFDHPSGKPHYIFNIEVGSPQLIVSSPITQEQQSEAQLWYAELSKHGSISRVWRLLVASMSFQDDRLRSFMSAWSALEILVNKIFDIYRQLLFEELRGGGDHPEVRSMYIARMETVMKDKYRLNDKFAIVSTYLSRLDADKDAVVFDRLKEQRDLLSHGQDVPDKSLAVEAVQQLTQRYLRLHLSRGRTTARS